MGEGGLAFAALAADDATVVTVTAGMGAGGAAADTRTAGRTGVAGLEGAAQRGRKNAGGAPVEHLLNRCRLTAALARARQARHAFSALPGPEASSTPGLHSVAMLQAAWIGHCNIRCNAALLQAAKIGRSNVRCNAAMLPAARIRR